MVIPIICSVIFLISIAGIFSHMYINRHPEVKSRIQLAKKADEKYCTKHIVRQQGPGGPDQLEWVYGPHRTSGNACDGSEHRRHPWWAW